MHPLHVGHPAPVEAFPAAPAHPHQSSASGPHTRRDPGIAVHTTRGRGDGTAADGRPSAVRSRHVAEWEREFGLQVRAWRTARGITATHVAHALGVVLSTVLNAETGRRRLSPALEVRLIEFMAAYDANRAGALCRCGDCVPCELRGTRATAARRHLVLVSPAAPAETGDRLLPGPGERQECARTSACLGDWIRSASKGRQHDDAHCPQVCTAFQPIDRDAALHAASAGRAVGWSA